MDGSLIRPATEADLQRLVAVEVAAGRVFRTVGMAKVARTFPRSLVCGRLSKRSGCG